MRRLLRLGVGTAIVALGAAAAEATPVPIFEYRFNEPNTGSNTSSASTGSNTTAVSFLNSSSAAADLHGAAGSGVTGAAGDIAFNNTASTTMGGSGISVGSGGAARQAGSPQTAMDNLKSWTATGWFKSDGATNPLANQANLISNISNGGGFAIRVPPSSAAGTLMLETLSGNATSSAIYATPNTWVFFAVTYDSMASSNSVKFYVGTTSTLSPASLPVSNAVSGTSGATTNTLTIGNGNSVTRPFDGFMDNVRVYGSTADGSGALSASDIETIRSADVSVSPEPSTGLVLVMAGTFGLGRRRRRPARS